MSETSRYLHALAERIAAAYVSSTQPRAILLTGSVATEDCDFHSDIDFVMYYDERPTEEQISTAHDRIGIGARRDNNIYVDGVECDIGYLIVDEWERDLRHLLEEWEARTWRHKAAEGVLQGTPLHGADVIGHWQARLQAYPDGLARAMVVAYFQFWPLWRVRDWFAARDTKLWYYQTMVESSQNILGVLAGINRLYFTPMYFKRAHEFIGRLRVAPPDLANRLDSLFELDYKSAVGELERLVDETTTIVEAKMPDVDTALVRRDLGARREPWNPQRQF